MFLGDANKSLLAFDQRYKAQKVRDYSHSIVEFDPISVPQPNGQPLVVTNTDLRAEEGARSRYEKETVRINLGMMARPIGKSIK